MLRAGPLLTLLLAAGCGGAEETPPNKAQPSTGEAAPAAPHAAPDADMAAEGQAAAAALRRYYELIGSGRYRDAWAMRSSAPGKETVSYEAFAEHYGRYAVYGATVGTPPPAVEHEGKLYAEIQVQRFGRMRDGSPIANVGTVSLHRSVAGTAEERAWKVSG